MDRELRGDESAKVGGDRRGLARSAQLTLPKSDLCFLHSEGAGEGAEGVQRVL